MDGWRGERGNWKGGGVGRGEWSVYSRREILKKYENEVPVLGCKDLLYHVCFSI